MNCDRFVALIDEYLADRLDGGDRDAWREHMAGCPACRERALAKEPTLMFAALPKRLPDAGAVSACAQGVRSLIHRDSLVHRLHVRSRRWLAAAAAVVVILGGGLLWRAQVGSEAGRAAVPSAASRIHVAAPAPEIDVEMPNDHVRIYQFAVRGNDLAVTYVVNPGMEL
ncbi:MAG: zf-HC2 domain-containing protein [Acidobacteria bacterium]|nr:zf-HC2 domain-containing protein [Acidobacteriota bacterium]